MAKTEQVKKPIPINELETTKFTDVIEIERIVKPDEVKRVDHIFVRRRKICKGNPIETFVTEEYARFDIAWPEEFKQEIKEEVKEEVNININS